MPKLDDGPTEVKPPARSAIARLAADREVAMTCAP